MAKYRIRLYPQPTHNYWIQEADSMRELYSMVCVELNGRGYLRWEKVEETNDSVCVKCDENKMAKPGFLFCSECLGLV